MKHASLIAAACAALLGGCVHQEYHTDAKVNTDPLVVDQAMQLRDWDKSHANYENGGTKNWSTGFAYASRGDLEYGVDYLVDLGTFFGNVVTLPVTAYNERDGVISSGVNVPESYTAVPQVPPRYRPTGTGVGPVDNGLQNGQTVAPGAANNSDGLRDNSLNSNSGVTANPNNSGAAAGGLPANNNAGNGTASDAANADVSSGGTGANGKPNNSGSATGSGAGGSSGAAGKK